jgi:hypothetical protein
MQDAIFILLTVGLFALAELYVRSCARLGERKTHD